MTLDVFFKRTVTLCHSTPFKIFHRYKTCTTEKLALRCGFRNESEPRCKFKSSQICLHSKWSLVEPVKKDRYSKPHTREPASAHASPDSARLTTRLSRVRRPRARRRRPAESVVKSWMRRRGGALVTECVWDGTRQRQTEYAMAKDRAG
ncbi:hypothetical protein EVAR_35225_1 [Eumeta japonica]|uniref:Uncharacterized protein n=1 Tax=Eumeta variegata TaxID=151549 RepID=A0A4C1VCR2_EUMVA|nr:hypothetical protein EVAR_35225_1 [Eumeta japonica]